MDNIRVSIMNEKVANMREERERGGQVWPETNEFIMIVRKGSGEGQTLGGAGSGINKSNQ